MVAAADDLHSTKCWSRYEQAAAEEQSKKEVEAAAAVAAAAARESVDSLRTSLAEKTEQLSLQLSRNKELAADIERAALVLQSKESELSSTRCELQVSADAFAA